MRPILAALVALAAGSAVAGPPPIHLVCAAARPALCAALAESLGRAGGRTVALFNSADPARDRGRLTLRYVPESAGPAHVAGRLEWRRADGRRGAGPPLEMSVTDATLSDAMLADYANALVARSDPPV